MDNSDKHIKSTIKESFDSVKKKAPEGLWKNISSVSTISGEDYAIRKSYISNELNAPDKTWNGVRRQLIIDDVWDNIAALQDRRRAFFWWFGTGAACLITFLLLIPSLYNSNSAIQHETHDEKNIVETVPVHQMEESNEDLYPSLTKSENNEEGLISYSDITEVNSDSKLVDKNINSSVIRGHSAQTSTSYKTNSTSELDLDSMKTIDRIDIEIFPICEIQPLSAELIIPEPRVDIEIKEDKPLSKFELGISGDFGNSWLFNNDVKNGMNSKSLVKNNFSLGYDIGTQLIYYLNAQSGLELQYDFISIHNQGYDFYNEGRIYHKDIKLKTHKITIDYRIRFTRRPLKNANIVLKSGMFFMHSIKEQTSINWVENTPNSTFSTINFGLNLGLGKEHEIGSFKLEYGLKSDIGLYNITANTISFPKKFDYATTFYLGSYVSLRYFF